MKTLTLCPNNFDTETTFSVRIPRHPFAGFRCALYRDYQKIGDGIFWIMQCGGTLQASYSPAEIAERNRLNSEPPAEHGETVRILGESDLFRVRVLGDFSDCAILDRIS